MVSTRAQARMSLGGGGGGGGGGDGDAAAVVRRRTRTRKRAASSSDDDGGGGDSARGAADGASASADTGATMAPPPPTPTATGPIKFNPLNLAFFDGSSDPLEWLRKPHTVTALLVGLVAVVYIAFTRGNGTDFVANTRFSIAMSAGIFLFFSMYHLPDGLYVRPHPLYWRLVMGVSVLYLMILTFFLFQSPDDGRQLLKYIDADLGVRLPERSYGEDCSLSYDTLMATLFDEFIIAHLMGWWAKAVLFRNAWFCWGISVLFELMEYTFAHMLPNFIECWWDHLIIDILVCNALGIVAGLAMCRYFQMKEYNWIGFWQTPTTKGKLVRAFSQFTPASFETYNWKVLEDFKHFSAIVLLVVFIELVELNAFFLKWVLWLPPPHVLVIGRLVLWGFMSLPALTEFYFFINGRTAKLGTMAWLVCFVAMTELLICIKYGVGTFDYDTHPTEVVVPWTVALVAFASWTAWFFGYHKPKMRRRALAAAGQ